MQENRLEHMAQFTEHLSGLQLSASAEKVLAETPLVLLAGPTATGRNTIIRELLRTGDYYNIISDTTRHIRMRDGVPIEENGREYWFRSEEDVLADVLNGEFLEAAIIHKQQVSGISIREIQLAHQAGQIAITDVEPGGASTIHKRKPDSIILFVIPPTFEAWMERLHGRSDVPQAEIRRRLETACEEFETALKNDYYTFIVNKVLAEAVEEIDRVVKLGVSVAGHQEAGRHVTEQLLADVRAHLKRTVVRQRSV